MMRTVAELDLETQRWLPPLLDLVPDAAIQRFEYTFESTWKLLQVWLRQAEGVV